MTFFLNVLSVLNHANMSIKAKLKKPDEQTNIDKNRMTAKLDVSARYLKSLFLY